jgi:hypothetical protein
MIVPSPRSMLLTAPTMPCTPTGGLETVIDSGTALADPLLVTLRRRLLVWFSVTLPNENVDELSSFVHPVPSNFSNSMTAVGYVPATATTSSVAIPPSETMEKKHASLPATVGL